MPKYDIPLGHEALESMEFYSLTGHPYHSYAYRDIESYTALLLTYEEDQYILLGMRQGAADEEFFRGSISSINALMQLVTQFSGNTRARTEVGRELQDSFFPGLKTAESEAAVFVAKNDLRWYRITKESGRYKVEFDRHKAGFDNPTDWVGTFNSLEAAIAAI